MTPACVEHVLEHSKPCVTGCLSYGIREEPVTEYLTHTAAGCVRSEHCDLNHSAPWLNVLVKGHTAGWLCGNIFIWIQKKVAFLSVQIYNCDYGKQKQNQTITKLRHIRMALSKILQETICWFKPTTKRQSYHVGQQLESQLWLLKRQTSRQNIRQIHYRQNINNLKGSPQLLGFDMVKETSNYITIRVVK